MEKITVACLPELFDCVARRMAENEELLCRMDAEMGDGDLGLTMRKGFTALAQAARELVTQETELSKVLMKAGMKMTSAVPSTMGTLMGSGVMGGGKALTGHDSIGAAELALFYRGFADNVAKRGKCAAGDRTVLDALLPAAEQAERLSSQPLAVAAEGAVRGAYEGIEATKKMLPKFGKAAVFIDRAANREDQGALVAGLLTKGIYDYILKTNEEAAI